MDTSITNHIDTSLTAQITEARKELKRRQAVYPRMVRAESMTKEDEEKGITLQQAIIMSLEGLALHEKEQEKVRDNPSPHQHSLF